MTRAEEPRRDAGAADAGRRRAAAETPALPTLRVKGELSRVLRTDALRALDTGAIARFLSGRRWYGSKGRAPRSARIHDVIPLPWADARYAIARLAVETGPGDVAYLQLPLAICAADAFPADGERSGATCALEGRAGQTPRAVLARVQAKPDEGGEVDGVLFDATEDPGFRAQLAGALASGAAYAGDGARWVIERVASEPLTIGAETPSRVSAAEQSNTSIVYGDAVILKLFRRLEPGENPDVEIARFLTTRTSFRGTPPLLGLIRLEAGGEASVAGMLQRFETGSTDAWSWALSQARPWFRAESAAPRNPFVDDARTLGRTTRELHEALASDPADPEFGPRPATEKDVRGWADDARVSIDRGLSLLRDHAGAGELPGEAGELARAILSGVDAIETRLDTIVRAVGPHAGARIRHHGDYHLGQVLRTRDGRWMIIDFEGEPARPLAERRQRHSPLRDVAGMLRSFAYAAATAASEAADQRNTTVAARAPRWEQDARDAFLRGYLATGNPTSGILPDGDGVGALLTLFEIEKVFYELSYELNNRPDWVWIPLRGVARLLAAS